MIIKVRDGLFVLSSVSHVCSIFIVVILSSTLCYIGIKPCYVENPQYTVETLYSTIYYSKYFIELNIDKSTQYVAL